jgi:tryptophan-rich sensory protein
MKVAVSRSYPLLALFGVLSLVLLLAGGWLTYTGPGDWYYELDFPPFQPPPGLFTPAWVAVLSWLALSTAIISWIVQRNAFPLPNG